MIVTTLQYYKIAEIVKLNVVNKYDVDVLDKSGICMQSKISGKPFPKLERKSTTLQLVEYDVCDI